MFIVYPAAGLRNAASLECQWCFAGKQRNESPIIFKVLQNENLILLC